MSTDLILTTHVGSLPRPPHTGIDLISDGEMSKPGCSTYMTERMSGFGGKSDWLELHQDMIQFPDCRVRRDYNGPHNSDVPFTEILDAVLRGLAEHSRIRNGLHPVISRLGAVAPNRQRLGR